MTHDNSNEQAIAYGPGVDVEVDASGELWSVFIARAEVRNAVNRTCAESLAAAFRAFDDDPKARVAILSGRGGNFCAGADLKAVAAGTPNRVEPDGDGPMGPTRMQLSKPVIAAIEGYAVAGGLELACWCDLRVAARDAVFGVFCRRWGVPLIDGGSVRLPRLIGQSRAMDMILTGRPVPAEEALDFGLVNRLAEPGEALQRAMELAKQLASFPQTCLWGDRRSAIEQWDLPFQDAMANELAHGMAALETEVLSGAARFSSGAGRHGAFDEDPKG